MQTHFFDGPRPRIFAHRGASGTAPENTLPAFERAIEMGADILEMDVHATSDGHIVVIHDPVVDRVTNGTGRVSELTLEDLKKLDAGYRLSPDGGETFPYRGKGVTIPTLRQVAEAFPNIPFNIEVKESELPNERSVFDLLSQLNHMRLTLLAAENDAMMQRIRALESGIPTNFCGSEVLEFIQRMNLNDWYKYASPGNALQIPETYGDIRLLTPVLLEAAHGFGIEVHIWTVNAVPDMRRMLEMGVDGIMTDHPERMLKVVRELGLHPETKSRGT